MSLITQCKSVFHKLNSFKPKFLNTIATNNEEESSVSAILHLNEDFKKVDKSNPKIIEDKGMTNETYQENDKALIYDSKTDNFDSNGETDLLTKKKRNRNSFNIDNDKFEN